jgi:hypothetical protein
MQSGEERVSAVAVHHDAIDFGKLEGGAQAVKAVKTVEAIETIETTETIDSCTRAM